MTMRKEAANQFSLPRWPRSLNVIGLKLAGRYVCESSPSHVLGGGGWQLSNFEGKIIISRPTFDVQEDWTSISQEVQRYACQDLRIVVPCVSSFFERPGRLARLQSYLRIN